MSVLMCVWPFIIPFLLTLGPALGFMAASSLLYSFIIFYGSFAMLDVHAASPWIHLPGFILYLAWLLPHSEIKNHNLEDI